VTLSARPASASALRARFPYLEEVAYLNTASASPSAIDVAGAAEAFHRAIKVKGIDARPEWLAKIETVRARLGAYLGAPAERVGFHGSCTEAMNLVAHSIAGKAPFLVVVDREDHPAIWNPWLGAESTNVSVHFAESRGGEPREASLLSAAVAIGAQAMALSEVDSWTGARIDFPKISAQCRERNVLLIVDGTQAAGAVPVDATLADAYMGSVFKWLLAGFGLGYLVLSPALSARLTPAFRGYKNEPPSRDLRYGHINLGGLYELDAALALLEAGRDLGLANQAQSLASRLRRALIDDGYSIATPEFHAGIVTVDCGGSERVMAELATQDVSVAALPRGIRISAHLYNTEGDVDRCVRAFARVDLGSDRRTSPTLRSAQT
jgi:selenocysteine lyase/cysteine desulfurase